MRGLLYAGLSPLEFSIELNRFNDLVEQCDVLLFDRMSIFEKSVDIWARLPKGAPIRDHDILIGSLAHVHGLTIVTQDKHFLNMDDYIDANIQDWSK